MKNNKNYVSILCVLLMGAAFVPNMMNASEEEAAHFHLINVRELQTEEQVLQAARAAVSPIEVGQLFNWVLIKGFTNAFIYLCDHKGVNAHVSDNGGHNPLHIAAWHGHVDLVRYLVEKQGLSIGKTRNGKTPLYFAAYQGHVAVVEYLIRHGANINLAGGYGDMPLTAAVVQGHLPVVKCLIKNRAQFNKRHEGGMTVLHTAAAAGHLDVVKFLVQDCKMPVDIDSDIGTPLNVAVSHGRLSVVKYFTQNGAALHNAQGPGRAPATVLHTAAESGRRDVADFLIKTCNIDIDVLTSEMPGQGVTPLFFAARAGNIKMMDYLLDNGADTEGARLIVGIQPVIYPPLYVATQARDLDAVVLLIRRGAIVPDGALQGLLRSGDLEYVLWAVMNSLYDEKIDIKPFASFLNNLLPKYLMSLSDATQTPALQKVCALLVYAMPWPEDAGYSMSPCLFHSLYFKGKSHVDQLRDACAPVKNDLPRDVSTLILRDFADVPADIFQAAPRIDDEQSETDSDESDQVIDENQDEDALSSGDAGDDEESLGSFEAQDSDSVECMHGSATALQEEGEALFSDGDSEGTDEEQEGQSSEEDDDTSGDERPAKRQRRS